MKFTFALGVFSGALALPQPHVTGSHKVSLSKGGSLTHPNGSARIPHIFASLDTTLAKFQKLKPHLHGEPVAQHHAEQTAGGRRGMAHRPSNLPLTDLYQLGPWKDTCYYGPVTIGSNDGNAQEFQLLFDTGSCDIWVPNLECGALEGCPNPTKYDEGGTDLHKTARLVYLQGTAYGELYTDDVTIAGLRSFNQTLLSTNSSSSLPTGAVDGIAGMGFSGTAGSHGPTFFENLIASGAVEQDEFSFYFGRTASGTGNDSELTLGGRDSTKYYQQFTTVPVNSTLGVWQVALDDVRVNGRPTGPHSAENDAFIDTGTSVILAPHAAADEIMSQIPNSMGLPVVEEGDDHIYLYPCDTHARYIPSLIFAGTTFDINPLDFNLGDLASLIGRSDTDGYCVAAIRGIDADFFVIGNTFLKNWYTVFSFSANDGKPAVLFAPSIGRLLG